MKTKKSKLSLAKTHPELAAQLHPIKNIHINITTISQSCTKQVIWICENGHEWLSTPRGRTKAQNSICKQCVSLAYTHPDIAKEWHSTRNIGLSIYDFNSGSHKVVWWTCSINKDHEWQSEIRGRVKGIGCQVCNNRIAIKDNCLLITHPKIAQEWDYDINNSLKIQPNTITAISRKKVAWKCNNNHKWEAVIRDRTAKNTKCGYCIGRKVSIDNNLRVTHPQIALQWHPTKNKTLLPEQFTKGSEVKIWWKCSYVENHEWEAYIYSRTSGRDCPYCNYWSIESIRLFIISLIPNLHTFEPIELYSIFLQNGSLNSNGKSRTFIKNFVSGKIPKDILENVSDTPLKFVEFVENQSDLLIEDNNELKTFDESNVITQENDLPIIETKDILAAIDNKIIASADEETIDFLIKSAVAKIWRHAFYDEKKAHTQLEQYQDKGMYANEVKKLFTKGYYGAKNLIIPIGYSFHSQPNLMQRYIAYLVQKEKRIGNWSGTGSGKTLSAILASRIIDARLTIICTPNNVIDNWKRQIHATYPDSLIYTKEVILSLKNTKDRHQYLILNYEFFQQPNSEIKLKKLIENVDIDFIIIDEIHYSRQKKVEQISKRKLLITAFLSQVSLKNNNLHVLGMSATPVINNLFEGKTMIELVTGAEHKDLNTKITVNNCIALYKKFVIHGIREMPRYKYKVNQIIEEIDCSAEIPEIKELQNIVKLEAILTKTKMPSIKKHLRPKTIVYTFYRQGIESILQNEIEQRGWKTAFFNGDNKEGLDSFIEGDADILIASSCVGTGVDRLQTVCNRLIINCLPWTHAEFEQLKGRIYRQGQLKNEIDVIIPITYANINGTRWSWCDSKLKRVNYKKDISSAAVDGVIPEGHLRTPEQSHKDIMQLLARLDKGELHTLDRQIINIPLTEEMQSIAKRTISDLSKKNLKINKETSNETHERFINNPQEWAEYHKIYREARQGWPVIPYQEAIKYCMARPNKIVGDFGCGEAFLSKELMNKVYSFDHIAINENVIACDISHVPLIDSILDIAVFSLSLMGTNFIDYLREAKRSLKLDGLLWIAEPTSRIKDITLFKELLERIGFAVLPIHIKGQFTFISALKTERDVNEIAIQNINYTNVLD